MFKTELKPYDRGAADFRKGAPPMQNPFPKHSPPRNDDDRWYQWRQGWRRTEMDAIIAEKGTCAGEHVGCGSEGEICDIGGAGWVNLDSLHSLHDDIQCTTCGEIWSLDWGGYVHETDMEAARNAELGHSFPKAAVECAKCGMRDSDAKDAPCPNRAGEAALTEWFDASRTKGKAEAALAAANRAFDKANHALPIRPCPNTAIDAACKTACAVCRGAGAIGKG